MARAGSSPQALIAFLLLRLAQKTVRNTLGLFDGLDDRESPADRQDSQRKLEFKWAKT